MHLNCPIDWLESDICENITYLVFLSAIYHNVTWQDQWFLWELFPVKQNLCYNT